MKFRDLFSQILRISGAQCRRRKQEGQPDRFHITAFVTSFEFNR
jgi:hypothetical protein